MIHLKNALRRRWQRLSQGAEKQRLKSEFNAMQKQINRSIVTERNSRVSSQLRSVGKGAKKLWKLAKKAKGKTDSSVEKIKIDGQTV